MANQNNKRYLYLDPLIQVRGKPVSCRFVTATNSKDPVKHLRLREYAVAKKIDPKVRVYEDFFVQPYSDEPMLVWEIGSKKLGMVLPRDLVIVDETSCRIRPDIVERIAQIVTGCFPKSLPFGTDLKSVSKGDEDFPLYHNLDKKIYRRLKASEEGFIGTVYGSMGFSYLKRALKMADDVNLAGELKFLDVPCFYESMDFINYNTKMRFLNLDLPAVIKAVENHDSDSSESFEVYLDGLYNAGILNETEVSYCLNHYRELERCVNHKEDSPVFRYHRPEPFSVFRVEGDKVVKWGD